MYRIDVVALGNPPTRLFRVRFARFSQNFQFSILTFLGIEFYSRLQWRHLSLGGIPFPTITVYSRAPTAQFRSTRLRRGTV